MRQWPLTVRSCAKFRIFGRALLIASSARRVLTTSDVALHRNERGHRRLLSTLLVAVAVGQTCDGSLASWGDVLGLRRVVRCAGLSGGFGGNPVAVELHEVVGGGDQTPFG